MEFFFSLKLSFVRNVNLVVMDEDYFYYLVLDIKYNDLKDMFRDVKVRY